MQMKLAHFRVFAWSLALIVHTVTGNSLSDNTGNDECPSGLYVTSFSVEQYPRLIRLGRLKGTVRMQVNINPDGDVSGLDVIETSHQAPGYMSQASVKKWKFGPKAALPTTIPVLFTYEFQGEPTDHVATSRIEADLPCSVKIITNPALPSEPTVITPRNN